LIAEYVHIGVFSQLLAGWNINVPSSQSVSNYVLLIFFGFILSFRSKKCTLSEIDEPQLETAENDLLVNDPSAHFVKPSEQQTQEIPTAQIISPSLKQYVLQRKMAVYLFLSIADVEANYAGT
jgi:hypothetical protein